MPVTRLDRTPPSQLETEQAHPISHRQRRRRTLGRVDRELGARLRTWRDAGEMAVRRRLELATDRIAAEPQPLPLCPRCVRILLSASQPMTDDERAAKRIRSNRETAVILAVGGGLIAAAAVVAPTLVATYVVGLVGVRIVATAGFNGFLTWREGKTTLAQRERAQRVVDEVAAKAGVDAPEVTVYKVDFLPNAAAALGKTKHTHKAKMLMTTGALIKLDDRKLAAVVAHEIEHLRAGHLKGKLLGMVPQWGASGWRNYLLFAAVVTGRVAVAPLAIASAAVFTVRAVRKKAERKAEFEADLGSARITQDPQALAGALRDITIGGKVRKPTVLTWALSPRPSHPPTYDRIQRLNNLAVQGTPKPPAADRGGLDF